MLGVSVAPSGFGRGGGGGGGGAAFASCAPPPSSSSSSSSSSTISPFLFAGFVPHLFHDIFELLLLLTFLLLFLRSLHGIGTNTYNVRLRRSIILILRFRHLSTLATVYLHQVRKLHQGPSTNKLAPAQSNELAPPPLPPWVRDNSNRNLCHPVFH